MGDDLLLLPNCREIYGRKLSENLHYKAKFLAATAHQASICWPCGGNPVGDRQK